MHVGAHFAASVDGVRIAYEVHGAAAPALVFIHGWSCDRNYWSGQLQWFARRFKVVAIDLAGHGESGIGRTQWTIQAFGDDVASVVDELALPQLILIGHSMGGDVIVAAARRLRDRVRGLVWVDTYNQLGTPRTSDEIDAILAPFRSRFAEETDRFVRNLFAPAADRVLVDRVARDMSSAPPEIALAAMKSSISFDREIPRSLLELKLPHVAINPDYRPTDVASMSRYGVEVVIMQGVSHFLMMEAPDRFNQVLMNVIDSF